MEIADLHCDLLCYLECDPKRTPMNPEVRCSIPQLKKGGVHFQTLAIFTETQEDCVGSAARQLKIFSDLSKNYSETFRELNTLTLPKPDNKVNIAIAVENASGFCAESEPLQKAFERFEYFQKQGGPIIYVSLTWNQENRFAGGNASKVGLKRDGELFLEYLCAKQVAIDLSHTSDQTADDILNLIDKKGLKILPIASHSNFRAIADHPRNLPDRLAKEILKRGGVIGLNFFKPFVGTHFPDDFARQVEHAVSLGALNQFCFGADFFYDRQLPTSLYPLPFYYTPFDSAECYPKLVDYLTKILSKSELENIASKNINEFFQRLGATS